LKSEPVFTTVLREEELVRIKELDGLENDIEFARLFLIVNCNIGLRFSDLLEVIKEYSIINNELRIRQVKTNTIVVLPINTEVNEMIQKLQSLYRPSIDRKIINSALKEVGKLAKMNDIETSVKVLGNKRITVKKKRWELLTTHVGRRTFATRAAEKNVPLHIIMKYTGHKNLSTLQNYIKSSSFGSHNIIEGLWD
jgi:integrase